MIAVVGVGVVVIVVDVVVVIDEEIQQQLCDLLRVTCQKVVDFPTAQPPPQQQQKSTVSPLGFLFCFTYADKFTRFTARYGR